MDDGEEISTVPLYLRTDKYKLWSQLSPAQYFSSANAPASVQKLEFDVWVASQPRSGDEPGFFDDVFDRKSFEAAQDFSADRRRRRRRAAVDRLGEQPRVRERVSR